MSDPIFVSDLEQKFSSGEFLPSLPERILRKKVEERMGGIFVISAFFHIVPFLGVWIAPYIGFDFLSSTKPRDVKDMKSAIRVEVVELPSIALKDLQKVDVLQEVGESRVDSPAPPKETMALPQESAAIKKKEKNKAEAESAQKRLQELQSRLRAEARRREILDKASQKVGRERLGGNILSEGYSVTGDIAREVDVYQGQLLTHVRRFWNIPSWMQASTLNAQVLVRVGPGGKILSKEFVRRSGNNEFDSEVSRALELADPLPAPPENLRVRFLEEGVIWGFPQ